MCPWNVRSARPLGEPAYAPRPALAGEAARTLAWDILGRTQAEFRGAFSRSPMKRAKRRGLKRNAAVVLGNLGTVEDVPALQGTLDDEDPLVREHAAWALARLGRRRRALKPCARRPARDVAVLAGAQAESAGSSSRY